MFGILRISDKRLTAEEREVYKAQFCGSCHALRGYGGLPASLLTNYDQTVLSLCAAALAPADPAAIAPRPLRCTAVPFRRVGVAPLPDPAADAVAALTIAAAGAKLRDDVQDDGRLLSRTALSLLRSRERRAWRTLADQGFPVEVIRGLPRRQTAVESAAVATLRSLAAPSADLTAAAFGHLARVSCRDALRPSLERFGAALGTFVYLQDAVDDLSRDLERGRFNAIARVFGPWHDLDQAASTARIAVAEAQHAALDECHAALDQLDGLEPIRAGILRKLLGTQRAKVFARVGAGDSSASSRPELARLRAREAGDCDCGACDACNCDACGSEPGCSCSCNGCGGADADASAGSVLPCGCCEVCVCCDLCCWSSERRQRRRRERDSSKRKT